MPPFALSRELTRTATVSKEKDFSVLSAIAVEVLSEDDACAIVNDIVARSGVGCGF